MMMIDDFIILMMIMMIDHGGGVISSYHHIDCDKYDHHLRLDDNYVILCTKYSHSPLN
jgi:hypothetical protein